jgi:hypothetical protein
VGALVLVWVEQEARTLVAVRKPINRKPIFSFNALLVSEDGITRIISQEVKNSHHGLKAKAIP